jgi:hypothetical protein
MGARTCHSAPLGHGELAIDRQASFGKEAAPERSTARIWGARTSALTTAVLIPSMTHENTPTDINMHHERALLIRVVGSAIRQTWLKVAAGR